MPNSKYVSLEENPIGCNGINFLCEEMLVAKPNTGNTECGGENQHQEGKVPKSILHGLSLPWKISPPKASFSLYLYTSRFKASFMRGLTQTASIGKNWYKEVT